MKDEKITQEETYKMGECVPLLPLSFEGYIVEEAYLLKRGEVERKVKIYPNGEIKDITNRLEFQDIRVYLKPMEREE